MNAENVDDIAAVAGPGGDATRTHLDPLLRLAEGSLLAERYRIGRLLGMGGMGLVYQARDEALDLDVAIKVLRPEFAAESLLVERFRRELVLARQVSHRNVVRIHDIGQDGELSFLTMDFVQGRSLRQVIREQGRFDAERVVALGLQLAGALEAAHAEGVVHRDLKPSNVMLDDEDRAYVTDFGVARSLSAAGLTRTGTVVGTPDYLSPEQAQGEEVDGRSDIYALGIILFEMLSGELPFQSGSLVEVLAQKATGRRRSLQEVGVTVPLWLDRVIRRCLEAEPARRYASASELARDLERRAMPRRRLDWRRAALVAALILAVAGTGWWAAGRWRARGAAATAAEGVVERPLSVAVLPLRDETGNRELAWVAPALTELVAAALAESADLRVVDPARLGQALADLRLPAGDWDDSSLRRVAGLFEADRLLSGRVRGAAGEVVVDARLHDAAGGTIELSAESATAELLPGVAQALARQVGGRLELGGAVSQAAPAVPPAALSALSRGVERLRAGDLVGAREPLEAATAAAPDYAPAWLGLSEVLDGLGYYDRAREAAAKAVELARGRGDRWSLASRARLALLDGEAEASRELLQQLVAAYPNDVESAIALSDAYGEEGRFNDALTELRRVVAVDPSHPTAWYLLGKYSILNGESRRAADEYLVRALVIQNKLRNAQGRGDVLNAFGAAYRDLGDLDQAAENFRQAATIRDQIGDRRGHATSVRNLAFVSMLRGDYESAEQDFVTALASLEAIGDEAGVADLHNDLGVMAEEQGLYKKALESYRHALQLRRDAGDEREMAESLNNVGFAYFLLGEYDNASVYMEQALSSYEATGNREGVALAQQSVGQLQLARGEWDAAVKSYLEALRLSRELEFTPAIAVSLGNLGRVAHLQGRWSAALASFDEALAVLSEIDDTRGMAEFTLSRAETFLALGRFDEAESQLVKVGEWLEGSANHAQLAEWQRLRGLLARHRGNLPAAVEALGEALEQARESGSRVGLLSVRADAAAVRLAAGVAADRQLLELREILGEVEQLGHLPLELQALEALAGGEAPAEAETLARLGLRRAGRAGSWGGAFRLNARLVRLASERGDLETRSRQLRLAQAELTRLRQGLADDDLAAFAELPEVAYIERELAEEADD